MCYTRRKTESGVGALREFDDTNFLKPIGQSRNLNIYAYPTGLIIKLAIVTPQNEDENGIKIGSVRSNSYLEY